MDTLSSWFGSQGFMPHGHCFLWTPSILWLSVISDALIALAYLTIPITLLYFIRKRRDLPFDWMFIAFGIFILACGSTHVADIWVIWHPDYWLSVILKTITAAASVVTAVVLVRLVPVALRIAMERAEVANRAKSAFLAAMSHELRTPLNAILGYTQILKRDKGLTPTQKSGVGTIQQGGQHLLALINDVLDLSRVEAGKMDFHPKPVVLADLLSVVADIMRVRAEQKQLRFELELVAGLPEAISVDETRLRQVLLNLLGNAVKFTDRGTVRLRVLPLAARPGAAPDAASLRFEVHDDGIGIAAGHIDAIFRPFEQVGDASRRAGGTGLGLAISGQLVRLMGGELKVESKLGTGSRFWFDVAMPVAAAPAAISGDGHNATGYLGPRKTILVVDDVAT